jgi:hypothetical protein
MALCTPVSSLSPRRRYFLPPLFPIAAPSPSASRRALCLYCRTSLRSACGRRRVGALRACGRQRSCLKTLLHEPRRGAITGVQRRVGLSALVRQQAPPWTGRVSLPPTLLPLLRASPQLRTPRQPLKPQPPPLDRLLTGTTFGRPRATADSQPW